MGDLILELVLQWLRQAELPAEAAYPGQMAPRISRTVAAAHIHQVDTAGQTVTVAVDVISPTRMGGAVCEREALRATQALQSAGAACVQNGCVYDGTAQVYTVSILAVFDCASGAEAWTVGPGFRVFIDGGQAVYAEAFTAEMEAEHKALYEMGENPPAEAVPGHWLWKLTLEERIPAGVREAGQSQDGFTLLLEGQTRRETFYGCFWTSIRQEYTKQGLRRIRTGFALSREEEDIG